MGSKLSLPLYSMLDCGVSTLGVPLPRKCFMHTFLRQCGTRAYYLCLPLSQRVWNKGSIPTKTLAFFVLISFIQLSCQPFSSMRVPLHVVVTILASTALFLYLLLSVSKQSVFSLRFIAVTHLLCTSRGECHLSGLSSFSICHSFLNFHISQDDSMTRMW